MKKIHFFLTIAMTTVLLTACGNNAESSKKSEDTTSIVPPPSDNNSATNPSMADTAYSKNHADTSTMKKDSLK